MTIAKGCENLRRQGKRIQDANRHTVNTEKVLFLVCSPLQIFITIRPYNLVDHDRMPQGKRFLKLSQSSHGGAAL